MKIAIGSDHRGFHAKEQLKRLLTQLGHEVTDYGTHSDHSTDYPDHAIPVCAAVAGGDADRGVLLCGSGIGMSITANKVHGIRAALCHDELTAEMSRRHNNANVLCLAADLLGEELIRRMVEIWMATEFDGGRHERRVEKIMAAEELDSPGDKAKGKAPAPKVKKPPKKP
jgi:ribose 5-phosphate isomerase B